MGDEPKKESNFWPVLKTPYFAPKCVGRRGIDLGQKLVGLLRAEGTFGAMTPSENVLSF